MADKILTLASVYAHFLAIFVAISCLPRAGLYAENVAPPPNVVMVHGILNNGKIFEPMIRVLEKQGCHCFAPSLTPNDCRHGIHALALQLSTDIDARFGKSRPIILVGFSLGGLVTRDYVQSLAAPNRVRGVFLISTPERGTLWASLAPGGGVKQLSFHSPFIASLQANLHAWQHLAVCSYWTPFDGMILPATSSRWSVGENQEVFCWLHPWMVRNHAVIADIAARIAAIKEFSPHARLDTRRETTGKTSLEDVREAAKRRQE